MQARQLKSQARDAFTSWISKDPWDLMVTLTDPGMSHPEAMSKRTRYLFSLVNKSLYGNHWNRRTLGVEWVTGYEQQNRGSWHTHSLVRLPDHDVNDPAHFSLAYWQKKASDLGGWAHLTRPRNQEAISAYVCKYVLKDGYIDLSSGFDPAAPRIYGNTVEGTARVH